MWHANNTNKIMFLCYLLREYVNYRNKFDVMNKKKDYWDEPITNFDRLRVYKSNIDITDVHFPTESEILSQNKKTLSVFKRVSYLGKITEEYRNIFKLPGKQGWIHNPMHNVDLFTSLETYIKTGYSPNDCIDKLLILSYNELQSKKKISDFKKIHIGFVNEYYNKNKSKIIKFTIIPIMGLNQLYTQNSEETNNSNTNVNHLYVPPRKKRRII